MTDYFVYETATGLVRWHTASPPATLDAGLASIAVPDGSDPLSPGNYSVVNGAVVARVYTLAQNRAIKVKAAIDYFNGLFTNPKGFTIQGATMQIDAASQANIGGAVSAALLSSQNPTDFSWDSGFYWVAADNSHIAMTAAQMVAFGHAVFEYVRLTRMNIRAIKDAIAAAAAQAALDAIDVTAGYPAASA
jgi:hypothetical protein